MIDRIVVVDSGQVIETTESAIIAKDEADRAEKWAKYSEEQANLASDKAIAAAASKEAAAQSAQSAANTVNGFDAHAAQKLSAYNSNAAQKLSAYNSNDATKTQAFNDNYTSKLNSFNTNASEKQAQVDASASAAKTSETNAKASELAASASEANAKDSENAAKVSETNAQASETAALASKNSAQASATTATTQAGIATTKASEASTSATNAKASETNAKISETNASNSADLAESWAIGNTTDRPEGSAKYWAEQAKTATAGTLNESILTNCLTEIPQDIKLELADGTLTLKAGSKVYKGDGTAVNISKDTTIFGTAGSGQFFATVLASGYSGSCTNVLKSFSGSGIEPQTFSLIYDTDSKILKRYGGDVTGGDEHSFPVAIVTITNNVITSIDRVFNGFGYIGSTIFALPGVEGLIPNGRNTDGSLNNLKYTINNLLTVQAGTTSNGYFGIVNGSLLRRYPANSVYDEAKNIWYNPETGNSFQFLYCGNFSEVSSRITSLTPNTAFHAVDYNEFAREVDRCAKVDEDNEFTGNNSFLSNGIILKNISIDRDINPNKNLYAQTVIRDKNDKQLGNFYVAQRTDGSMEAIMLATGRNGRDAKISISTSADGTFSTNVPTPPISDNSEQIANTVWVNNKFQKVSTLPAQPDPNVTYLIPEE